MDTHTRKMLFAEQPPRFHADQKKKEEESPTFVDLGHFLSSQRLGLFSLPGLQNRVLHRETVETHCAIPTRRPLLHTVRIFHRILARGPPRVVGPVEIYLGDPRRSGHCQFNRSNGLVHNRPAAGTCALLLFHVIHYIT